jgi:hypothetical protein
LAGKPLIGRSQGQQGRQDGQQAQPQLNKGSVLSAASTGIAALLLIGGGTVHRQFSVPNDVDDETAPRMGFQSAGARRLRAVELIVIDVIFPIFCLNSIF